MPTYEYKCDSCLNSFEQSRSITKPHPKKCPNCGEKYGDKFQQIFTNCRVTCIVYGNPTTVGQQAEINAKRVGKARLEEMTKKSQDRKSKISKNLPKGATTDVTQGETPWFRSGEVPGLPKMDKPLDLSKVKNTKKFIETGEKA